MKKLLALLLVMSTLLIAFSPLYDAAANDRYPHFLENNRSRYEAFQIKNPDLPLDKVIAYVNAHVDFGFYNQIVTVDDPDSISVLVNKNFALPSGYVPSLVSVGGSYRLRSEAAQHFTKMKTDMNDLGYKIHIMAAYRTYQTQANRYSNALRRSGRASADRQFARAGHSEHQTGLAIDVLHIGGFEFMQHSDFHNTPEFAWLTENAHRFGFILRYPQEYRDIHGFIFEPWHWRYIGVFNATAMYLEGIRVFEEFYGRYLAPDILTKWETEPIPWGRLCW